MSLTGLIQAQAPRGSTAGTIRDAQTRLEKVLGSLAGIDRIVSIL
jgi:hypothetical protein